MGNSEIKTIPPASMINMFPEIIYDKDQVPTKSLDIWNSFRVNILPQILANRSYFSYQVKSRDTLESLASRFYGTPRLWWLTLLVNDADDPFDFLPSVLNDDSADFGPAYNIKILRSEYINSILVEIRRLKTFVESLPEMDKEENG